MDINDTSRITIMSLEKVNRKVIIKSNVIRSLFIITNIQNEQS